MLEKDLQKCVVLSDLKLLFYQNHSKVLKMIILIMTLQILNQLLESADIISFHCKPSFDGSPIISTKEIIKMKKNAIIINTARGNLVSEADLSKAIKNETIKGAAIDVFADEPAKDNSLFGLDNVILTPHIAASTSEAQIIVAEMVANQFVDYFLRDISK